MQRREFLKGSSMVLAGTSMGRSSLAAIPKKRWNLLLLTADDMNWSIPGFMGSKLKLTPRLDGLATQCHRFVKNHASAPICQPSREAMMTGRVPHRSGGLGFDPIHEGLPTLVTLLKDQGYYTAGIHKTEHMQPPSCFPWDRNVAGKDRKPAGYGDAVAAAIRTAKNEGKPFFINCNIDDPHRPFYGSPQAAELDHHNEEGYSVAREVSPDEVEIPPILEDLPDIRKELAQYCNSAQRMDLSVGKVLDALKASGAEEDTIVMFSSDHGMPFPFSKATTYQFGTRTPALLRYPGMGRPRTIEDRTCNIDYLPTLLDLLKVPAPAGLDGRSWYPLLSKRAWAPEQYTVTHVNTSATGAQYPMRTVQDDLFALIFTPWSDGRFRLRTESMQGLTFKAMQKAAETNLEIAARVDQYTLGIPMALYDLSNDPGQRKNIIDEPQHKERVKAMKEFLHAYMKRTEDPQLENLEMYLAGKQPVVKQPAVLKFNLE